MTDWMPEFWWTVAVFGSFIVGMTVGAVAVALGATAGRDLPSPLSERIDAFLTVLESERSVHP